MNKGGECGNFWASENRIPQGHCNILTDSKTHSVSGMFSIEVFEENFNHLSLQSPTLNREY